MKINPPDFRERTQMNPLPPPPLLLIATVPRGTVENPPTTTGEYLYTREVDAPSLRARSSTADWITSSTHGQRGRARGPPRSRR